MKKCLKDRGTNLSCSIIKHEKYEEKIFLNLAFLGLLLPQV